MKQIALEIEDSHYDIMEHFAELHHEPVERFVLAAAKSTISACISAEEAGTFSPYELDCHPQLGGNG